MEIHKLKIPSGRINSFKIDNMNIYDILVHMQHTLIDRGGGCIINLLTSHMCLGTSNLTKELIRNFDDKVEKLANDPDVISKVKKLQCRAGNDQIRNESDEQYFMRMLQKTNEFKYIKCEECIQRWLNDEKW